MSSIDRSFCGLLLREAKKDLLKVLPYFAIKGTWTYKYDLGSTPLFEVHIPENETFPNGYFYYCSSYYSSEAKANAFGVILDRITRNELGGKYPINVTLEQVNKAKKNLAEIEKELFDE